MQTFLKTAVVLSLSGLAFTAGAAGTVEVNFEKPEQFRDVRDEYSLRTSQRVLDELASYIRKTAAPKLQDGQTLQVTVLDVDLAGEFRPIGSEMREVRVLNRISWPAMHLKYSLSGAGQPAASGDVKLADLDYQSGPRPSSLKEPLPYEKRLLDEWIREAVVKAGS